MSNKDWDSLSNAMKTLEAKGLPHWQNYLGFYSSWLNGYFKEPWGILMPIDDHGFHRGDGIFEAVRMQNRAFFDFRSHLARLGRSAELIGMKLPKSLEEIEAICVELARRCDVQDGLLRLFVTRGPGGFSPSPKEVVGHQIYAIINKLKLPDPKSYENGVRAMVSSVPPKDPWWSQIKSCNYLQNVLMKQEVIKKGYDFAIGVDHEGRVCEGSTENILALTARGEIVVPSFDYTLRGTTVSVVMRLAEKLKREGKVKDVRHGDLTVDDLKSAREVAFVGTTLGVLPVNSIDDKAIGNRKPGEVCKALHAALTNAIHTDPSVRVEY